VSTNDSWPETQVVFKASYHRGRWKCLRLWITKSGNRRADRIWLDWRTVVLYIGPLTLSVDFWPREEASR